MERKKLNETVTAEKFVIAETDCRNDRDQQK